MPLPHHIAIVSATREISARSVMQVAAALQKQIARDLLPVWGFPGTVNAFADLASVPSDYHPVVLFGDPAELADEMVALVGERPAQQLLDEFERGSVAGIHLNAITRQPFALVAAQDAWTIVLSHEVLEMLVDPWGNHMVASNHPRYPEQRVKYLIEICDPCLACWYPINGVPVADFYTPRYFDPVRVNCVRYSFTGSVEYPRQILEGGYLTYLDPSDSALYSLRWDSAEPILIADLPALARTSLPLRTLVDTHSGTPNPAATQFRAADGAGAVDAPLVGVSEAATGAAVSTASALYSLAIGG